MYYVLYDKDFQALGAKKTYKVSKWTFLERSFDFSELKIEGAAPEQEMYPTYVGLHDDRGHLKYCFFSGLPKIEKGIIQIAATDIRQLLNTDVLIDLTTPALDTVKKIYEYLLNRLSEYPRIGIIIQIDTNSLATNPPQLKEEALFRSREIGNLWNTIQSFNALYDCYIEVEVDIIQKKITFKVKRIGNEVDIKLEDFQTVKVKNDYTGVNRAFCANEAYEKGESGAEKKMYYLLNDDSVISESEINSLNEEKIIYPPRIKVFKKTEFEEARAEGIKELYNNRFKSNIEISAETKLGYILEKLDLTYMAKIYGFNSVDLNDYKKLPVMERHFEDNRLIKIKIGRLEEYWWLY